MVEQVQVPHSVVPGKSPLPSELAIAGLAVNLKDGTLFTKGYDEVVIPVGEVTYQKISAALKSPEAVAGREVLPQPASDLATAIALVNAIRQALIDFGIAS